LYVLCGELPVDCDFWGTEGRAQVTAGLLHEHPAHYPLMRRRFDWLGCDAGHIDLAIIKILSAVNFGAIVL
jgi:hypothetical protein